MNDSQLEKELGGSITGLFEELRQMAEEQDHQFGENLGLAITAGEQNQELIENNYLFDDYPVFTSSNSST